MGEEKVIVKIFLPSNMCSCSQTGFLGRIYEVVSKYRQFIAYSEASADSEQAKKYGVTYRGVLIGSKMLRGNPTSAVIEAALLGALESQGISVTG